MSEMGSLYVVGLKTCISLCRVTAALLPEVTAGVLPEVTAGLLARGSGIVAIRYVSVVLVILNLLSYLVGCITSFAPGISIIPPETGSRVFLGTDVFISANPPYIGAGGSSSSGNMGCL